MDLKIKFSVSFERQKHLAARMRYKLQQNADQKTMEMKEVSSSTIRMECRIIKSF